MENKKVTIIATDKIGRTESIKFIFPTNLADRLFKAAGMTYPDGSPCSELQKELNELYDNYKMGWKPEISTYQYRKLKSFFNLIYNKFYNYKLTIE